MSICRSVKRMPVAIVAIVSDLDRLPPVHVTEVRGARALRRDHQRTDRSLRRAFGAEQLAVLWLEHAFEHLAALGRLRVADLYVRHAEPRFGIPRRVLGPERERRLRDESQPA